MSIHWNRPVAVRIGSGIADVIRGPIDAFEALNNRWPAEHGESYFVAKALCSEAVATASSNDTVRDAFVDAAQDARLLI
ncbi:uncharacterized protein DUF982 [Rhizobium sp. PP-CC-3A-592]|nr:uncharacterized protein DUF982 [Rhizobium sp. PP-CC-3A-592]